MSLHSKAADYGIGEDQLKGALVLPLHSRMVLPRGTKCGFRLRACWIRITHSISCGAKRRQLHAVG